MYRSSDVRRVVAMLDELLEPPYDAEVQISPDRTTMRVVIMDPDDPQLPVAQAIWQYDGSKLMRKRKQPDDEEIETIVQALNRTCAEYPARKAAGLLEAEERKAMALLREANRRKEAEAAEAAERAKQPKPAAAEG